MAQCGPETRLGVGAATSLRAISPWGVDGPYLSERRLAESAREAPDVVARGSSAHVSQHELLRQFGSGHAARDAAHRHQLQRATLRKLHDAQI